ncbi:MAG: DUF1841 family protein [Paralcaligenes sp.]
MFNPSREQVRQFFTEAWRKHRHAELISPLEAMAIDVIVQHPEYYGDLENENAAQADYTVEQGKTNPFLHLSMHLAIAEQLSIDQPPGIKAAWQQLQASRDAHEATHEIMESLGQVVWEAQRLGTPFNSETYLELIRQRATRG